MSESMALVFDGGYKHKSVGKLGDWGVFVFTDDQLEVYKTMQQKLKKSWGVTGLLANILADDFEFKDKTADIIIPYSEITSIQKHSKFLMDPAIKIIDKDQSELLLYIKPKKNIPQISEKVLKVNAKVEIKQ